MLPVKDDERKKYPIASGVLDYFPDVIVGLAEISDAGNKQHHPDKPLFWNREKSTDHADCLMRHFMQRGKLDKDGKRHTLKMVWRACALAQLELEGARHTECPPSAAG